MKVELKRPFSAGKFGRFDKGPVDFPGGIDILPSDAVIKDGEFAGMTARDARTKGPVRVAPKVEPKIEPEKKPTI